MIRIIYVLGLILILQACSSKQPDITHKQIVEKWSEGLNTGNFNLMSDYLHDSIVFTEFDFVLASNKKEYYFHFQWDSIFSPKYKLSNFKTLDSTIHFTLTKNCKRINFLQDTSFISKFEISINDNKITRIHTSEYIYWDSTKWNMNRTSILNWTNKNHPELAGFLYDQTLQGGRNYLKAINLYRLEE